MAVLVVDDEPSVRRVMTLALRAEGLDVHQAENGLAALELLALKPDLIILDLMMPVMDGRVFFHQARASGYNGPVLLVSAHDVERAREELKADGSMAKPFDPEQLVEKVRELLPTC
jgi:DNA-binding response OmpR family regulator